MDDNERAAVAALGRRLRLARLARGETQQQVADRAGISRSALSYIEKGETPPALLTVCRLAHVLGLPVAELLARP